MPMLIIIVVLVFPQILRSLLANTVHKEQLDCIITRAMTEADQDLDSCIDFEEFKQVR